MENQPNILFVTADHLRYDTVGHAGDPIIQTPTLDRLAADGVRFSNCFVQSPVCQPSRATLMTGRYPRHHGVRWNGNRLDENEMTIVEFFKRHGYTTASVGKHHIQQERFTKHLDGLDASGLRRNWRENPDGVYEIDVPNPFEQYVRDRGYEYKTGYALPNFRERLGAVPSDLPADCHLDAYVAMEAQEYLSQYRSEEPFFLWLGFYGPHHPYVPSGRFADMYDPRTVPPFARSHQDLMKKPLEYRLYFEAEAHKFHGFAEASEATFRQMKSAYYGMVSQLDWALGQVLETLQVRGLRQRTIVVFISDHGEFLGDHGIPAKAPFLLDCMLHVPCLISVPDGKRGILAERLVESTDLFPTLARLAGLEAPPWLQGRDMFSPSADREIVYAEAVDKRCIRTREWKLIHYPAKDYGELYHLTEDPHELDNRYMDQAELRDKMTLDLYRHLDATEDFRHPVYPRFTGRSAETGEEVTHYLTW